MYRLVRVQRLLWYFYSENTRKGGKFHLEFIFLSIKEEVGWFELVYFIVHRFTSLSYIELLNVLIDQISISNPNQVVKWLVHHLFIDD